MNAWILLAGVSLSFITADTNNLLFKFSSFWLNWTFNSMLVVKFWTMRHSGVSILCLRVSRLREDFCLSQKDKMQFDFHLFYKEASETGFDSMWQQINTRNFVKKQVFACLATVILNVSLNTEHVTETVLYLDQSIWCCYFTQAIFILHSQHHIPNVKNWKKPYFI